jgi:hypothetical protein
MSPVALPTDGPADFISVTLPESLVAGDTVSVYVDVRGATGCGDRFLGFAALQVPRGVTRISGAIRHFPNAVCPLDINGPHRLYAFRALVPTSGERLLHFTCPSGAIDVRLAPSLDAHPPEHRVELRPRFAGTPIDGLLVSYLYHSYPADSVTTSHTDASGVSVATPPCLPSPGWWSVYLGTPLAASWMVELPDSLGPCTRAMRTIVPYLPPQRVPAVVTSWRASPALYGRRLSAEPSLTVEPEHVAANNRPPSR